MENNRTVAINHNIPTKENLSDRAIIVVIGNLVSGLGKILLPILFVRLIGKTDYGTFRQALMLYTTFGVIFLFGIPQSIYYFIPQISKANQKKIAAQSFIALFLFGLLLTIIFYFLSGHIAEWFNNDALTRYVKIFSFYFLFMLPAQALIPLLISINRHRAAAITSIAFMTVTVVSALLPLLFGFGLREIFMSMVFFAFIQFLLVILYAVKTLHGLAWKWDRKFFSRQFAFAFPVGLNSMVGIISKVVDKYIISFAFTPERFAIYEIGAKEIPLVNILPYSVSNVLQPRLVEYYHKGDLKKFIKIWHEAIRKVSLIVLPIFVFLFIVAHEFIVLLYTPNYIESVPLFRIYLLILPLRVTAYGPILLATGRPKFVFWATCIGLGFNICLSIILLNTVGFIGPAIATVMTQCGVIMLYLKKISQVIHLDFWKIFPFQNFLQILAVSTFCGCAIYPILLLKISPSIVLLAGVALFCMLYAVALKMLKILKQDDMLILKRWLTLGMSVKKIPEARED